MLLTQATTLDIIFKRFARKAAHCECLNQMQAHMVLALKAQPQSRATVTACGQMCGQKRELCGHSHERRQGVRA